MSWILTAIFGIHGLIHLMGPAKAFGYAELPQLTQPTSRGLGAMWLTAAVLVTASAAMYALDARRFWMVGLLAAVVSQLVIASAWRDAWAGTIANIVLLAVVGHAWLIEGPTSFRAQYERDANAGFARAASAAVIAESDLAPLPAPVQRYLRKVGIVGQPRVQSYRLRFRGRIRSDATSAWMPFEADQQSFADEPTRLFLMRARMRGVPVQAFHRSVLGHATMQVKVAGVVTMVDARGDDMDRAEAVTLLNDMCLLAPATLVDARIQWEPVDDRTSRARFTHGGHTVAATLVFGEDGLLTDFVSDDRWRSIEGKAFTRQRFSTPVRSYRTFGPLRLAAEAEARWHPPEGAFTYGEFELVDIAFNVRP